MLLDYTIEICTLQQDIFSYNLERLPNMEEAFAIGILIC